MLLLGCEGDKVESPTPDSATLPDSTTSDTELTVDSTTAVDSTTMIDSARSESSPADSAADSAVGDSGPADSSTTDADAAPCPAVVGNLITDGEFSTGSGAWIPENCSTSIVSGRCGRNGLRLYDASYYGRVHHDYEGVAYPKGTKLHLRAWVKKSTGASAEPPGIFVRTWYPTDAGGADYDEWIAASGPLTDTWTYVDRVFTLVHDQTAFSVYIASYYVATDGGPASDEFEVSDVSLVVE